MPRADAELRPEFYVRVLGRFEAKRPDGSFVDLPKKAQALICFLLAQRDGSASRDSLAGLLWSRGSPAEARHSLRQCLATLRQRLPAKAAAALLIDPISVGIAASTQLMADLRIFEARLGSPDAADLAEAHALCAAPLLDGCSLRHEPFFDWLLAERERLAGQYLALTEKLARAAWTAGHTQSAIAHARALVKADPLREQSSRLLMEFLAGSGQRGDALLELADLKRRLRDELQVDPEPLTLALAERIRRGSPCREKLASIPRGAAASAPLESATAARMTRRARRRAGEPSVAVLPFKNWTGSSSLDPLALALAEDVATALACDRMLNVDATSANPNAWVRARSGLAHYAITGSVRDTGSNLVIAVQLVCGSTRRSLWSGRVDTDHRGAIVDSRAALALAAQLSFAIRSIETRNAQRIPVEQMSVVQLALASAALSRKAKAGNAAAVSMLRAAIDEEPDLGLLHAALARCFHVQRMMGWLSPVDSRLAHGLEHARQALDLSFDDSEAMWMAGLAFLNIGGDLAEAQHAIDLSLSLNPSSANAHVAACFLDCQSGHVDSAIGHARQACELNPNDNSHHVQKSAVATALFVAGDYAAADDACTSGLVQRPGYANALRIKIATASLLGKKREAETAARDLLRREPDASVARMRDYWRWLAPNAPDALDAKLEGWRLAGMPD